MSSFNSFFMKNFTLKIFILSFLLFFISFDSKSQIVKTEYFMQTSYLRTYMNPAFAPDQGQIIIPVLPNIGANIQTNTINLDHLTFKRNGERVTFIHPSVSNQEFLSKIKNDNYLQADVNYKLFAIGLFLKEYYTNFDIGFRTHADINLPKSTFALLKVGFDQDTNSQYNLKNLSATASSFIEIGASQSRQFLNKTLAIGIRAKFLLGAGYLDLDAKNLEIEAGPNSWRALSHVSLKGAAPGVKPKYDSNGFIDGFDFDSEGIPGYGAGLDIGAVYDLGQTLPVLDGLKVSAALNDIGFISWSKNNSLALYSPTTEVIITPNDYTIGDKSNNLSDVLKDAFDDIKNAINLQEDGDARRGVTTSLRMNMYLGAEYELMKDKLSLGALYYARFGNYYTTNELTLSGNYQPLQWLETSLSYSVMFSSFDTFGLGVHIKPKRGVTFMIASDYVIPHVSTQFLPTSSKGVNLQLGFSIPIGKNQKSIDSSDN